MQMQQIFLHLCVYNTFCISLPNRICKNIFNFVFFSFLNFLFNKWTPSLVTVLSQIGDMADFHFIRKTDSFYTNK